LLISIGTKLIKMSFLVFFSVLWCVCANAIPTEDSWAKAKSLVQQMTVEEKFSMMYTPSLPCNHLFLLIFLVRAGVKGTYVGNTKAIERLNIPALKMHDGPQGFRATGSCFSVISFV
jgi:hypothetical protein